jgi:L-ribulose-5-phosphate 3-epimerase
VNRSVTRRGFVQSSVAFLAGASIAGRAVSADEPGADTQPEPDDEPDTAALFSISLAQWSLHKALYTRKLDNLDFAATAKNKFDIDAIEYVNQFFKDKANDDGYLTQMKKRADDLGVRSVLIMCDGEGRLGDPDDAARKQAVENHHKWVKAAKFLGCHAIRVNAASEGGYEEQQKLAADGLRRLCEFADTHGLNVLVENHGGLSSNGQWLAGVMELIDHDRAGTLPDFGNFRIKQGEWYDRYRGVEELMPYAKAVSAKSYAFDDAGNETEINYRRMMKIVLAAGYHGHVGIEYEGSQLSEMEGIAATKALLERVRAESA